MSREKIFALAGYFTDEAVIAHEAEKPDASVGRIWFPADPDSPPQADPLQAEKKAIPLKSGTRLGPSR